jgi:hypothetical protein
VALALVEAQLRIRAAASLLAYASADRIDLKLALWGARALTAAARSWLGQAI